MPIRVRHNLPVAYHLNLFSPATYETFSKSDRTVSGFQERHQALAKRVTPGDSLREKLSRWLDTASTSMPVTATRTGSPTCVED